MTWLIITNTNHCRIYDFSRKPKKMDLLKELLHPDAMLKDQDLTSDKPGRYRSNDASGHGAYMPRSDAHENEITQFARDIAKEMDSGRKNNRYDKIILVAPPHMYGLIKEHLDRHVKNSIDLAIQKDYSSLKEPQIWEELQKDLLPEKKGQARK